MPPPHPPAVAVRKFETTKTTYPVLIPKSLFFFYTKEDIMESERSPLFLERKKVQMQYFFRSFKKEKCNYTTRKKTKPTKRKIDIKTNPKKLFREVTSTNYSLTRNHFLSKNCKRMYLYRGSSGGRTCTQDIG